MAFYHLSSMPKHSWFIFFDRYLLVFPYFDLINTPEYFFLLSIIASTLSFIEIHINHSWNIFSWYSHASRSYKSACVLCLIDSDLYSVYSFLTFCLYFIFRTSFHHLRCINSSFSPLQTCSLGWNKNLFKKVYEEIQLICFFW